MLASVRVFTFKAGLFAKLAHDLRLRVTHFEIVIERGKLEAWFDANSLRVEDAMKGQVLEPATLSEQDKQRIHATLQHEVLNTQTHARVTFSGETRAISPQQVHVHGSLQLRGRVQPLELDAQLAGTKLRASVTLTPSKFGIEPYKALGGAIRLQDRVVIEFEFELGASALSTLLDSTEAMRFAPV